MQWLRYSMEEKVRELLKLKDNRGKHLRCNKEKKMAWHVEKNKRTFNQPLHYKKTFEISRNLTYAQRTLTEGAYKHTRWKWQDGGIVKWGRGESMNVELWKGWVKYVNRLIFAEWRWCSKRNEETIVVIAGHCLRDGDGLNKWKPNTEEILDNYCFTFFPFSFFPE